MADVMLRPGQTTLADWRAIYRGAGVTLDPACHAAVVAGARAVEAILARGEPVYGINTGFGRLASIRIEPADLATLQRNIVLSHAAGVGEPMPAPLVRLMLALKLASLGQGASGARLETVQFLAAMLSHDLLPVVPTQGSVGASGDLAPLAHMAAAMIGVGEIEARGRTQACRRGTGAGRPAADRAWRQGGTCAAERHAILHGLCARGACSRRRRCCRPAWSPARCPPMPHAVPMRRSIRASTRCAAIEDRSTLPAPLRALIAGSAIRASHLTGDDRVQDPYCLRCQPQVMGAALDILRHAAATLRDRSERRIGQSADLRRSAGSAVGRQLPRRTGRLRRRHHRARVVRDRCHRRTPHRHADRSGAVAACRRS